MKKILILLFFSIFLSGCSYKNELFFKRNNQQGIISFQEQQYELAQENYQKSISFLPDWSWITENNISGVLYESKKFKEAETLYSKLAETKCNIAKNETISPFCENIFYGLGNTFYRLGESEKEEKQMNQWQNAIRNYQKTLQINSQNTWAKENIEFIQKKLAEPKAEKQKQDSEKEKGDSQDSESDSKKDKSKEGKQHLEPEDEDFSEENKEEENGENESSEEGESSSDSKEGNIESEDQTGSPQPSRLPLEMQKELEQYQKELEANESQNQQHFQRNSEAAEQNQNKDPFDNLFQQFFGNSPQNFHKNLPNKDEKDW